jgi:hypothetical protein
MGANVRFQIYPVLAVTVFYLLSAGAGHADDDGKVDCSQIDMKFAAPGYEVDCSDLSKASLTVEEEAVGARKTERLFAASQEDATFLVAIDNRLLGSRIYIRRSGFEKNVENYFSAARIDDWSPENSADGFEVATFSGGPSDGRPMNCIGFRREVSQRFQGLGRLVVGIACSAGSVKHAYDALGKLDAPGK